MALTQQLQPPPWQLWAVPAEWAHDSASHFPPKTTAPTHCLRRMLMQWCRMKSMQTRVTSPQKTTAASSSEALGCSGFKMSACRIHSIQWHWKLLAKCLQHVSKMSPVDDSFLILHYLSRIQDNDQNMCMNPTKRLQPPPLQFWAVPEAEWAHSVTLWQQQRPFCLQCFDAYFKLYIIPGKQPNQVNRS